MARESTIGSVFYLEDARQVSSPFSAVTVGTTTELTVAALPAGAVAGGWAVVKGSGIASLDTESPHRIISADATSVVLQTDTTGEGPGVAGTIEVIDFIEVCFSEFTPNAPEPGEVDVTTMCDTKRRTVAGLSSPGSVTFGGPHDMAAEGVRHLIAAQKDGVARALTWVTRSGQSASMFGQVSSFLAAPQGVEQAVTFTGTFQVQEGPFYNGELP